MKSNPRNAWNIPTGHDTILNGMLIAVGLVSLMLSIATGGGVA
jgi:hypothetical protein